MKKITLIFSLVFIVAIGIYFYTYQSHRDIATETPDYVLTLSNLQKDFMTNDSLFNAKYADKTIEIYGKITAIDLKNQSIMLDDKIAVSFNKLVANSLKISDTTFIKGRYVGFDDLLEEFKIDQAIVLKK
jgi:Flp pilus assembly protein TadG